MLKNYLIIKKIFQDNINNSYIVYYINGENIRANKSTSINKYIILEYAEKGCLLGYIIYSKNDLNEKYSKLLFWKLKRNKGIYVVISYHCNIKLKIYY